MAATILDVEAGSRTIYHAWVSDFAGQFPCELLSLDGMSDGMQDLPEP